MEQFHKKSKSLIRTDFHQDNRLGSARIEVTRQGIAFRLWGETEYYLGAQEKKRGSRSKAVTENKRSITWLSAQTPFLSSFDFLYFLRRISAQKGRWILCEYIDYWDIAVIVYPMRIFTHASVAATWDSYHPATQGLNYCTRCFSLDFRGFIR